MSALYFADLFIFLALDSLGLFSWMDTEFSQRLFSHLTRRSHGFCPWSYPCTILCCFICVSLHLFTPGWSQLDCIFHLRCWAQLTIILSRIPVVSSESWVYSFFFVGRLLMYSQFLLRRSVYIVCRRMDRFYVGRTCLELYPFLLAFQFIEIQVFKMFHNDRLDFSAILFFLFLILFTCVFSPLSFG